MTFESAIGQVELRTAAEEFEFRECETIVREGWGHFACVAARGLARIR